MISYVQIPCGLHLVSRNYFGYEMDYFLKGIWISFVYFFLLNLIVIISFNNINPMLVLEIFVLTIESMNCFAMFLSITYIYLLLSCFKINRSDVNCSHNLR